MYTFTYTNTHTNINANWSKYTKYIYIHYEKQEDLKQLDSRDQLPAAALRARKWQRAAGGAESSDHDLEFAEVVESDLSDFSLVKILKSQIYGQLCIAHWGAR